MKVAFIDTFLVLKDISIILSIKVINLIGGGNVNTEEDSHSAICLKIFEENLNDLSMCDTYLYTVMADYQKGNVDELITALDLCINEKVDIINMSIGTTDIKDGKKIERKLQEVLNKGIKVVAAMSNSGSYTYPASCTGTIGVTHNVRCLVKGMVSNKKEKAGEWISVYAPNKVSGRNGDISIRICNSFATSLVTAHLVNESVN